MKIRKFSAPDMSRALRLVREELGPDAVIISNRKDGRMIELIAASDYDPVLFEASRKEVEAMVGAPPASSEPREKPREATMPAAPLKIPVQPTDRPGQAGAKARAQRDVVVEVRDASRPSVESQLEERAAQAQYTEIQRELHAMRALLDQQLREWGRERLKIQEPTRAQWVQQLLHAGFDEATARALTRQVAADRNADRGWHDVLVRLSQQLPVVQKDLEPGMRVLFFGPPGAGKTTTLIKLASRFVLQHGAARLRLVSMDDQRLGARAQLEALAAILGVPLTTAGSLDELPSTGHDTLTLVDTPAMPTREIEREDFVRRHGFRPGWESWQVLPATALPSVLEHEIQQGQALQPECLVLTQLDHAVQLGSALSVLMRHDLPLAWISDGAQIPEDLQRARAARLVVRAMEQPSERGVQPLPKSLYTAGKTA